MFISLPSEEGKLISIPYNNIPVSVPVLRKSIESKVFGCNFYLLYNGKVLQNDDVIGDGVVHAIPKLIGGKGGFGSMLRAIGAQIEKTTNREACRDLSGRRLRDINEEKRLKNWIAQQAEREHEAAERRRKKLERLCVEPKHDFKDASYEKERSELTDKVSDAVEQGFRASSQNSGVKRKQQSKDLLPGKKKKKACLWMDAGEDELSSSLDSDDSEAAGTVSSLTQSGAGCSHSAAIEAGPASDEDKGKKYLSSNDDPEVGTSGNMLDQTVVIA